MIFTFSGKDISLEYEVGAGVATIISMTVNDASYLKPGVSHLVKDMLTFMALAERLGLKTVMVKPDRSAMRLAFEEIGFRGDAVMSLQPDQRAPDVMLDYGRPGGLGGDVEVSLADGRSISVDLLDIGDVVLGGGEVVEILRAKVKFALKSTLGLTSCLVVHIGTQGRQPLRNYETSEVVDFPEGIEMIFISTTNHRLCVNGIWIEDMWGSDARARNRRISVGQVIEALNENDAQCLTS